MSNRYILLKYSADGQAEPIDSFLASDMDEAKDALRWMVKHHPERADLRLETGEFFEILDEEHCPPGEWSSFMEKLERKRAARRGKGEARERGKGI